MSLKGALEGGALTDGTVIHSMTVPLRNNYYTFKQNHKSI